MSFQKLFLPEGVFEQVVLAEAPVCQKQKVFTQYKLNIYNDVSRFPCLSFSISVFGFVKTGPLSNHKNWPSQERIQFLSTKLHLPERNFSRPEKGQTYKTQPVISKYFKKCSRMWLGTTTEHCWIPKIKYL